MYLYETCMHINFQQNRVSQNRAHKFICKKVENYINLQLAIRISNNRAFRTCTTPRRTIRPILRPIYLLDVRLPRKEIIYTDGRTDRQAAQQTDGQTDDTTDGRTNRQTTLQTDGRTDVAYDNNR